MSSPALPRRESAPPQERLGAALRIVARSYAGLGLLHGDGRIAALNVPALTALGLEEGADLLDRDLAALWPAEERPSVDRALDTVAQGASAVLDVDVARLRGTRGDGRCRLVLSACDDGMVLVALDRPRDD